ncbi:DUF1330 domain-containing protein [Tritonibacter sp. SIMBA_163]|uniref:DUF1330 domain-containing protein n=1 Tax=Tritonibacter sp. SIMBA_163 TaxID=3080868 RepID=UPI003980E855
MTTHVIVLSKPDPAKADGARRYADAVQPLLKAAGVVPTLRAPVAASVAGKATPATVLVLEFADEAVARGFFDQPAYRDLIPLRDDSFAHMEIHILGG